MSLFFPTYQEWFQEIQCLMLKTRISLNNEDIHDIFFRVDTLLRQSLAIPPDHYSDHNRVVEQCVRAIEYLPEGPKKIGALAYINALRKSCDRVTKLVAENIVSLLLERYILKVS